MNIVCIGYIKAGKLSSLVNIGVWLVFAFLLLNILGNLIAAPITVILALCILKLAIEKGTE
jgi:hypothetical protein